MKRAATTLVPVLLIAAVLSACSDKDTTSSSATTTVTVAAPVVTGVVTSDDPRATQIAGLVRNAVPELKLQSVVFGVWVGDQEIVRGAIDAPSVQPATPVDAKVRVGQPMEAMLGTVLLQLGSEGKINLDEPVREVRAQPRERRSHHATHVGKQHRRHPRLRARHRFPGAGRCQPVHRLHLRRVARLRPAVHTVVRARDAAGPTPTPRWRSWCRSSRRCRVSRCTT